MARNSTYNILMYSHDTYGLGHIRRTMAIASHLAGPKVNILILTGSPIAGRFAFPEKIDFVRIPGMIKKTNDEYFPMSIKINPKHALEIRKNIITATVKTFRPNLFIVDKEPLGLKREVLPTLQWLKRCMPKSKTILGLRDIMDDAQTVRGDWDKKGIYQVLDELYSEIWVYGNREFYNPITEYAISEPVSRKIRFTGYIPRKIPGTKAIKKIRKEQGVRNGKKLVVVTTGGGGDGYAVMNGFLSMLEQANNLPRFKSVLITGPFMPRRQRRDVYRRARRLGATAIRFYARMEELLAAADLVVGMGGYNTICEILSQDTISLIIPRETPRSEQFIRAQILGSHNLLDYIPLNSISPEALHDKFCHLLAEPQTYQTAISQFELTGLETMLKRLQDFRCRRI